MNFHLGISFSQTDNQTVHSWCITYIADEMRVKTWNHRGMSVRIPHQPFPRAVNYAPLLFAHCLCSLRKINLPLNGSSRLSSNESAAEFLSPFPSPLSHYLERTPRNDKITFNPVRLFIIDVVIHIGGWLTHRRRRRRRRNCRCRTVRSKYPTTVSENVTNIYLFCTYLFS